MSVQGTKLLVVPASCRPRRSSSTRRRATRGCRRRSPRRARPSSTAAPPPSSARAPRLWGRRRGEQPDDDAPARHAGDGAAHRRRRRRRPSASATRCRARLPRRLAASRPAARFGRYDAWALLWEVPRPGGTSPSRVGHAIASMDEQLYVYGARRAAARGGVRPQHADELQGQRSPTWRRCTATVVLGEPIVGHAMAAIDVAPGSQLARTTSSSSGRSCSSSAAATAGSHVTRGYRRQDARDAALVARGTPPTERVGAACLVRGRMFYVFNGGFVRPGTCSPPLPRPAVGDVDRWWAASSPTAGSTTPSLRSRRAPARNARRTAARLLFGGALRRPLQRPRVEKQEWGLEPSGLTPSLARPLGQAHRPSDVRLRWAVRWALAQRTRRARR